MKHKRLALLLSAFLILALGLGLGAYAASKLGTQADPLVAKSYLDQTVTPRLQQEFQAKLDEQVQILEGKISSGGTSDSNFAIVSLSQGQKLSASAGCELVLRAGTASGLGALTDMTEGKELSAGGGLQANHLYMAGSDGDGLSAGSAVTLLVRGSYTIS